MFLQISLDKITRKSRIAIFAFLISFVSPLFLQATDANAQLMFQQLPENRHLHRSSNSFGIADPERQELGLRTAEWRSQTAFIYIKRITYIYAGFGVIALVLLAVVGKWQWKWFFMICGGLFVLAGSQQLVYFLN
ncbi:MAG: hypothetical protein ACTSXQ_07050 [Alphaproteobacteria bacterium]